MAQATNRAFADERRTAIMEMLDHNASVQVAEIAPTWTRSPKQASCAARTAVPYHSTNV